MRPSLLNCNNSETMSHSCPSPTTRPWIAVILSRSLLILLGLLIAAVVLEIAFRLLPVTDSTETMPVNAANPYLHFRPNREMRASHGRFFEIQAVKRTNNEGYFSDLDFNRDSSKSKIAVIGDSYVEALQVANRDAVHGQLGALLGGAVEVYGIGSSGSALSQYLAYAQYAEDRFAPEIYSVIIVSNDFDESLLRYRRNSGRHYYDDQFNLVRIDFNLTLPKRILRQSAVYRYLVSHLKLLQVPFLNRAPTRKGAYVGNVEASATEEKIVWSKRAVDAFLKDLRMIVKDKPVIFVVDGLRESIYGLIEEQAARQSFASIMREYLLQRASSEGFLTLDLHPVFEERYHNTKERFEFETDWHWNALGHRVAAENIRRLLIQRKLIETQRDEALRNTASVEYP